MSIETNKENARRTFEEVINQGNMALADELFAPDYVGHAAGVPDFRGANGFKQFASIWRSAFPDIHMTIEDTIAEGEKVVSFWTSQGTHRGEMMGIPPTGKQGTMSGVTLSRYVNGKQVEAWVIMDRLEMLQKLGVAPEMKQAVA